MVSVEAIVEEYFDLFISVERIFECIFVCPDIYQRVFFMTQNSVLPDSAPTSFLYTSGCDHSNSRIHGATDNK